MFSVVHTICEEHAKLTTFPFWQAYLLVYHKDEVFEGHLDSNEATDLILPDILMGKFVNSGLNSCT